MKDKNFEINHNGLNIKCRLYAHEGIRNPESVVVSCHGFGGSKDNAFSRKMAEVLMDRHKSTAVLTFDWPAHGKDIKKQISKGICFDYLECVIEYIKDQLKTENIYVQAISFGGYIVLSYIKERNDPFINIALRSPAINMYDVLTKRILSEEQVEAVLRGKAEISVFDKKIIISRAFLNELETNRVTEHDYIDVADTIIVMNGTLDETVPFEETLSFCEKNVIDLVPVEWADHRYRKPEHVRKCIDTIEQFFSENGL